MFPWARAKALRVRLGVTLARIHQRLRQALCGRVYGARRWICIRYPSKCHAFIPVFCSCDVGYRKRCGMTPSKKFSDDCAHVWKMRGIGKGRETVVSDHGIYFSLRSAFYLWESNYSKCPPCRLVAVVTVPAPLQYSVSLPVEMGLIFFTYYNLPSRNDISSSLKESRSEFCIKNAQKVGRSPSLAFVIHYSSSGWCNEDEYVQGHI